MGYTKIYQIAKKRRKDMQRKGFDAFINRFLEYLCLTSSEMSFVSFKTKPKYIDSRCELCFLKNSYILFPFIELT